MYLLKTKLSIAAIISAKNGKIFIHMGMSSGKKINAAEITHNNQTQLFKCSAVL